jgi:hypothetical protein
MVSRSPIISIFSLKSSLQLESHAVWLHDLHGSPGHQQFQHSSLCILPFGLLSWGRGCSNLKLPQPMFYGRTTVTATTQAVPGLTLVSCFRPFACWPPSKPSYYRHGDAFRVHPHHGPPIPPGIQVRSHDTLAAARRGSESRHRFQRSSLRFSAALLAFLRLHPTSLLAVINAFRFRHGCQTCSELASEPGPTASD